MSRKNDFANDGIPCILRRTDSIGYFESSSLRIYPKGYYKHLIVSEF